MTPGRAGCCAGTSAASYLDRLAAERKLFTVPADAADAAKLADHHANAALGEITVDRDGPATVFDFGEWRSEVASRHNPDGTVSFLTTAPAPSGSSSSWAPGRSRA